MLVESIAHARLVKERLYRHYEKMRPSKGWLALDTETASKEDFPEGDALVYDRMDVLVFSVCFLGESYCFPTNKFNNRFPLMEEWAEEFLIPICLDPRIVKVAHNWTYDYNVFYTSLHVPRIVNFWDTLIGAWKASEYVEKGLKARAPLYGRFLRSTKTIKFTDIKDLAAYAEEDVVQTDEMYQMQRFGKILRRRVVFAVGDIGQLCAIKSPLVREKKETVVVNNEGLREFDKQWLKYLELPVLRAVTRAQRRGFPIDSSQLLDVRRRLQEETRKQLKYIYRTAGCVLNINAPAQIAEACVRLNIANPHKTKTGKASFSKHVLAKIAHTHPFLQAIGVVKALDKLRSVYVGSKPFSGNFKDPAIDCGLEYFVSLKDGAIHTTINTVGAVTGRASSSNPNLQQIPSRKDTFGIKACFVGTPRPAPYHVFVRKFPERLLIVLDYSQLEIRVMCLLCKDKTMQRVLVDPKGDIHQLTADEFGVDRDPSAKNLNFLLLYGGQEYMLSENLSFLGVPTTPQQALGYRMRHAQVYPRVPEYRQELLEHHQAHGYVVLFTGRRRHLPDIQWGNKYSEHKAETTLSNNVVQGSGQDFLKAAIVRSDWQCINPDAVMLQRVPKLPKLHRAYLADKARELERYRKILKAHDVRWRLQVHDESIFTVRPNGAEESLGILARIMSWRHYFPAISDYNVPLVAEGGVGENWKAAKSKDKFLFHAKEGYTEFEKYA